MRSTESLVPATRRDRDRQFGRVDTSGETERLLVWLDHLESLPQFMMLGSAHISCYAQHRATVLSTSAAEPGKPLPNSTITVCARPASIAAKR